jgi:hypothetical protein
MLRSSELRFLVAVVQPSASGVSLIGGKKRFVPMGNEWENSPVAGGNETGAASINMRRQKLTLRYQHPITQSGSSYPLRGPFARLILMRNVIRGVVMETTILCIVFRGFSDWQTLGFSSSIR